MEPALMFISRWGGWSEIWVTGMTRWQLWVWPLQCRVPAPHPQLSQTPLSTQEHGALSAEYCSQQQEIPKWWKGESLFQEDNHWRGYFVSFKTQWNISAAGLRVSVSPNLSSVSQTGHHSDNTTAVSTSFQSFYYTNNKWLIYVRRQGQRSMNTWTLCC